MFIVKIYHLLLFFTFSLCSCIDLPWKYVELTRNMFEILKQKIAIIINFNVLSFSYVYIKSVW